MFQNAWETATEHDRAAGQEKEVSGRDENDEAASVTTARDTVLTKVAARDVRLAEKYLREVLDEERMRDEASGDDVNASPGLSPWGEMSDEGARRLESPRITLTGDATRLLE